jgi:hypothetical protein
MLQLLMIRIYKVTVQKTCAFVENVVIGHWIEKVFPNQWVILFYFIFDYKGNVAETQ